MTSLAIALTVLLLLAVVQLYTLYQKIIIERKEKTNLLLKLSIMQEENQLVKETTESYYKELYKSWRINTEKEIRKDANKRSRSILRGQATEQIAPFLMEELNPNPVHRENSLPKTLSHSPPVSGAPATRLRFEFTLAHVYVIDKL